MRRFLIAVLSLSVSALFAGQALADECAPSKVVDLTVSNTGFHSARLTWTDPGDDCATGTATSFEIRISSSPITEANYYSATVLVTGEPAGAGCTSDCNAPYSATLLACNTTYYFVITFTDEAGNRSPVSNSPSGTIPSCNTQQISEC
jgi:hypothetical protein